MLLLVQQVTKHFTWKWIDIIDLHSFSLNPYHLFISTKTFLFFLLFNFLKILQIKLAPYNLFYMQKFKKETVAGLSFEVTTKVGYYRSCVFTHLR